MNAAVTFKYPFEILKWELLSVNNAEQTVTPSFFVVDLDEVEDFYRQFCGWDFNVSHGLLGKGEFG